MTKTLSMLLYGGFLIADVALILRGWAKWEQSAALMKVAFDAEFKARRCTELHATTANLSAAAAVLGKPAPMVSGILGSCSVEISDDFEFESYLQQNRSLPARWPNWFVRVRAR